jgi:prepilin-type N-terminal cleavage/methylation domain-containing protein
MTSVFKSSARRAHESAPRKRSGLSLVEILVAVMVMAVAMTFVGHISTGIAQTSRKSDIIAKRTFAMQQQASIVGALPFSSLNSTILPATKSFTLGDFTYTRLISLSVTGTATTGQKATIAITIVPQTGISSDTLLTESLTMYRSAPLCGTSLGMVAC